MNQKMFFFILKACKKQACSSFINAVLKGHELIQKDYIVIVSERGSIDKEMVFQVVACSGLV